MSGLAAAFALGCAFALPFALPFAFAFASGVCLGFVLPCAARALALALAFAFAAAGTKHAASASRFSGLAGAGSQLLVLVLHFFTDSGELSDIRRPTSEGLLVMFFLVSAVGSASKAFPFRTLAKALKEGSSKSNRSGSWSNLDGKGQSMGLKGTMA